MVLSRTRIGFSGKYGGIQDFVLSTSLVSVTVFSTGFRQDRILESYWIRCSGLAAPTTGGRGMLLCPRAFTKMPCVVCFLSFVYGSLFLANPRISIHPMKMLFLYKSSLSCMIRRSSFCLRGRSSSCTRRRSFCSRLYS